MIPPQELVERALAASTADGCAVIVTQTSEATLRWAGSTMTTNGCTTSWRWSVVSTVATRGADGALGVAAGVVSCSSVDPADVAPVVRASEAAARTNGPARDAAALVDGDAGPDWDDGAAETAVTVFAGFGTDLAAAFAASGRRLLYGFAEHRYDTTWLGTSTGLRRRWVQPTGSVELNAKTPDLTGSAWGGVATPDFADVDVARMVADLEERLAWGRRRVDLPAGRYETLLPSSAVSDLMIYLAWSMAGRPAQEGRSAFSAPGGTRVGERLTDLPLVLASDPRARGLEYAPFVTATSSGDELSVFDNGAPTRRVEHVRDGRVHELLYNRGAAAELGATFTPPGDNLLLTGGSAASLADMVAGTGRGLLLTCLWYIREVDPTTLLLTGLTRDGVYLVEGGEVVGEVTNFRFNESPLDLLRRATEVGATARTLPREWKDWFTRAAMPPVRVPDFNMSSVSPAS